MPNGIRVEIIEVELREVLEGERWERERQEEEHRRWEEQERRRKEEEKIKRLEKWVPDCNQSHKIRQFLSEVEKAATENETQKTANLAEWIAWARAYADSIDPIHLTFRSASKPDNHT